MEGKGMLSWNLAEKREGTTWVCGRVVPATREGTQTRREGREMEETDEERDGLHRDESGDEEEDDEVRDTLEVWLQLVEVSLVHRLRVCFHFSRPDSLLLSLSGPFLYPDPVLVFFAVLCQPSSPRASDIRSHLATPTSLPGAEAAAAHSYAELIYQYGSG